MKRHITAILLILLALGAGLAELFGGLLPTVSYPFTLSRELSWLRCDFAVTPLLAPEGQLHYFGWLCTLVLLLLGILLLRHRPDTQRESELSLKWRRFKSLKRGYWSLLLLGFIILLAGMSQCIVGKRALIVSYNNSLYFPAFTRAVIPGSTFGMTGNAALAETDYHQLKQNIKGDGTGNWLLMPPIPYSATQNATDFPTEVLLLKDGRVMQSDGVSPYNGYASYLDSKGKESLRLRYRQGLPDGKAQGWDAQRQAVYIGHYQKGQVLQENYSSSQSKETYLQDCQAGGLHRIYYHPAPPLKGGHLLGTNSQGTDIAAYLYAGLQVNIQAILFYIPIVYLIGLSMGMMMGYFGGKFDLVTQRFIEILSQLPFIFVVMILADFLPVQMHGMLLILVLLSLFGWMQMTYMIRTATNREKKRDYVAAARTMGASTPRILCHHILPNLTAILITLIPFSIAALILSLASLDYLGFGLPPDYASWGRLINDGLNKLTSPWILSSAFTALVFTLLLISFIGEAIREAFDPRKHSYYR